jgi:hypothetical protein
MKRYVRSTFRDADVDFETVVISLRRSKASVVSLW